MGGSELLSQVLIAKEGSSFMNLANATNRVPDNTGLVYEGLPCAEPAFTPMVTMAENHHTTNKFFSRPGRPTLRRAECAFGLYIRSTGSAGTFTDKMFDALDACFGKQVTTSASYTVSSWLSGTSATLASVSGLKPGCGFAVTVSGRKYVSFIRSISGTTITFAPSIPGVVSAAPATIRGGRTYALGRDYAADSSVSLEMCKEDYAYHGFGFQGKTLEIPLTTGEMATANVTMIAGYAPAVEAPLEIGATEEPPGTWLKFLNAMLLIDGSETAVHSAKFSLDFAPVPDVSQANEGGLVGWHMGKPSISAVLELSTFDATFTSKVDNGTEFSVLAYMGTSANGSTVAIYMPAAHLTEYPNPVNLNDLTAQPLNVRCGNTESDGVDFNAADDEVSNTIFRMFFERGA